MKNLKMGAFVLAVAFFAMGANAAAQNLGEVVYQQTISTTLAKSLLYHFVATFSNTQVTPNRVLFDTAMELANVRTDTTRANTPGTFEIVAINQDGTVIRATSDQLTSASMTGNLTTVSGHKGLTETAVFFITDFFKDRGAIPARFVGYAIINHSFPVGTGVANVIDFGTGSGFNISYVAAQFK
ncbi:MAG TPA: hypothetical protein VGL91_10700 [Acidobacteriota bacterium]|jgi:hypothetical protein